MRSVSSGSFWSGYISSQASANWSVDFEATIQEALLPGLEGKCVLGGLLRKIHCPRGPRGH